MKSVNVTGVRRRVAVLTAAVAALSVIGLGAVGALGSGSAIASSGSVTPISVAMPVPTANLSIPNLALAAHLFPKDLNVTVSVVAATTLPALFATGQVQFVVAGAPLVETAAVAGAPVADLGYWINPPNAQLVAKNVSSIAGLQGKTLGITAPGAYDDLMILTILKEHNVDPSTVHFVALSTLSSLTAAYQSGTIDGFLMTPPTTSDLLSTVPGSHELFNVATSKIDFPTGVGGYLPWIKSHRSQAEQFLTAMNQAVEKFRSAPALAEATILGMSPSTPASLLIAGYRASRNGMLSSMQPTTISVVKSVLSVLRANGNTAATANLAAKIAQPQYVSSAIAGKKK